MTKYLGADTVLPPPEGVLRGTAGVRGRVGGGGGVWGVVGGCVSCLHPAREPCAAVESSETEQPCLPDQTLSLELCPTFGTSSCDCFLLLRT